MKDPIHVVGIQIILLVAKRLVILQVRLDLLMKCLQLPRPPDRQVKIKQKVGHQISR